MAYDVVIIGSGPNGLSAAIYFQQKGFQTLVLEGKDEIGGSTRTEAITLPGFKHDIGSAVHPMAVASPFFRTLPLSQFGLEWIYPDIPLAHPFPNGDAITMPASTDDFIKELGRDGEAYEKLICPLVREWERLAPDLLSPLGWPSNPFLLARFGLRAFWPAALLAGKLFCEPRTKAFFYGLASHSGLPMEATASSSFGLVLAATAHAVGWPFPKGGAAAIPEAMAGYLISLGGTITRNHPVRSISELPRARVYLFDVTPAQLLKIDGLNLTSGYRRKLQEYRYGPGVFKMDFALSEPVPWKNSSCARAGTIHLGSSAEEIAISERHLSKGVHPQAPYIILSQPTLFDKDRAPEGKHTLWAYCHVPNGSTSDMSENIIRQIESVAPGFRDTIIAMKSSNCSDMEAWNPNLVGGDVNGGLQDLGQLFFRPVMKYKPYRTSRNDIYLCSSSTPPGGGVHGMCGYHAAKTAFEDHFS